MASILHDERAIKREMAKQLRDLADRVERFGLYEGSLETDDKADFKKGEEIEMRTYTHVTIDLKIKRKSK